MLDVRGTDPAALRKLIVPPPLGKWRDYAADAWFRGHETVCETTLADFFGSGTAAEPPPLTLRSVDEAADAPSPDDILELQPA